MSRAVLVTGASRGIGAAVAEAYAAAGWRVLAPTRADLDFTDLDAVEAALGTGAFDADALVHCAGINPVAPLAEATLADWRRTIDVNLGGAFLLLRALGPRMAARGWGRVVLVSSAWSVLGRAGRAPYAASKGGVNALARVGAVEWADQGVLVNALAPGYVDTEMTRRNNPPEAIEAIAARIPAGRLALPAEVASAVLWLGSEANAYINGQTVVLDGGFSVQGGPPR